MPSLQRVLVLSVYWLSLLDEELESVDITSTSSFFTSIVPDWRPSEGRWGLMSCVPVPTAPAEAPICQKLPGGPLPTGVPPIAAPPSGMKKIRVGVINCQTHVLESCLDISLEMLSSRIHTHTHKQFPMHSIFVSTDVSQSQTEFVLNNKQTWKATKTTRDKRKRGLCPGEYWFTIHTARDREKDNNNNNRNRH